MIVVSGFKYTGIYVPQLTKKPYFKHKALICVRTRWESCVGLF